MIKPLALKDMSEQTKILLIDNYDSFVHNLARYLRRLGCATEVVRNNEIDVAETQALSPDAIVLSPGPGAPEDAGNSLEIARTLGAEIPLLGICLGHQIIAAALGGKVVRATEPWHGRSSEIIHNGCNLFHNLPSPLTVGRYHSLIAEPKTLPPELEARAQTEDGTIMAFAHRSLPVVGFQFHPESILTLGGYQLLYNYLMLAGLPCTLPPNDELVREVIPPYDAPWSSPASLPGQR